MNKKVLALALCIGSAVAISGTVIGLSAWQVIVARTHVKPEMVSYKVEFYESTASAATKTLTLLEIDSGFDLYTPTSSEKHFNHWYYKTSGGNVTLSGASAQFNTIYNNTSEKENMTIKLYASWQSYADDTNYATINVTAEGKTTYTLVTKAVTNFYMYNITPSFLESNEYVSKYTYNNTVELLPNDVVNLTTSTTVFTELQRNTNRVITLVATIATKTGQ